MEKRGYEGHFAPKPASSCLQVSANGDGCAIFVKRRKLRVVSRETVTLALSKAEVSVDASSVDAGQDGDGGPPVTDKGFEKKVVGTKDKGKDTTRRAQNQVALMVVCEFVGAGVGADPDCSDGGDGGGGGRGGVRVDDALDDRAPYLILSTTHLKAAKSKSGERYRVSEVKQLLESVARLHGSLGATPYTPAVVLTGDFNAVPCYETDVPGLVNVSAGSESASAVYFARSADAAEEQEQKRGAKTMKKSYEPLTYRTVKSHPLMFRSVYNDDVPDRLSRKERLVRNFYTTWKARRRHSWGTEQVVKHCIDYIFYVPGDPPAPHAAPPAAATATAVRDGEFPVPVLAPAPAPAPRIAARAVLDVYSDAEVGHQLLPSDLYPSDHLAIAADLSVSWDAVPRVGPLRRP